MFGELGYEGATAEKIAHRASVTRPALRHHFPSKRAIYDEIVATTSADVTSAALAADREDTLVNQLTAFLGTVVTSDRKRASDTAFFAALVLDSYRHPDLKQEVCAPREDTRAFLTSAVAGAVERGELADSDTDAVVEMLFAVMLGASFYGRLASADTAHSAVIDRLSALLSSGFHG
ncbi:MAG: TetR/AcrR family transcriptional regulator [Mycolicibacterium cosmeticum]|nr:TetR/AcrR family transcriptional regulator [Mycolicibacterium cosmeticum]